MDVARALRSTRAASMRAGAENQDADLRQEAAEIKNLAAEMRADIERSLARTLADRNPAMKQAGITPFTAFDTEREPSELSSYENHRYMMDWWTSDWGDPELDAGHFAHRKLAGQQILGNEYGRRLSRALPTSWSMARWQAASGRTTIGRFFSPSMETSAMPWIRGTVMPPKTRYLPGNYPGEGSPYAWSAVINSDLQPTLGLRWLLCYEEHDHDVVHLQKAAPQHWFRPGEVIRVRNCPTRFGPISWSTQALQPPPGPLAGRWRLLLRALRRRPRDPHSSGGPKPLRSASLGEVHPNYVAIAAKLLEGKSRLEIEVT